MKYEYKQYWTSDFAPQKKGRYIPEIIKAIASYNPESILELGSGQGYTSRAIKKKFPRCHLTGIDIIKGNEYLDTYIKADLSEYDTDKTYDCIVAQNILLHIKPEHIKELLNRMLRWSKNIVAFDYDPKIVIPLADHNFRHDFSIFPHKIRLNEYNSLFFT